MATERHDVAFIVGAVLGGMAGATATLLYAPQSGARTRSQLAEQGRMLRQGAESAPSRLHVEDRVRQVAGMTERATASAAATVSGFISHEPATSSADVPDTAATPLTEPVGLLPDPLEPDPIVETAPATSGDETDDTRDIVLDGPRPASADQERTGERL